MTSHPQASGTRVKTLCATWPWVSSTTHEVNITLTASVAERQQHLQELLLLRTSMSQSWALRWVCPSQPFMVSLHTLGSPLGLSGLPLTGSSYRIQSYTVYRFSHMCTDPLLPQLRNLQHIVSFTVESWVASAIFDSGICESVT